MNTPYVKIGTIVRVVSGDFANKLATVVDIVDHNTVLVDGPMHITGVHRQVMNLKVLSITPLTVKIGRGARSKSLVKAWKAADIEAKWASSTKAIKIAARERRAQLTDFERFQVMILRKKKSQIVGKATAKALKASRK